MDKGKLYFFCLFFFKLNYQLAHVNGNNNQGASCYVLIHVFALSPPLAPQVGLIGQIDGPKAKWTKVINIYPVFWTLGGVGVGEIHERNRAFPSLLLFLQKWAGRLLD